MSLIVKRSLVSVGRTGQTVSIILLRARLEFFCFFPPDFSCYCSLMNRTVLSLTLLVLVFTISIPSAPQARQPLRVLVFGAHPDDPEKSGGTMAKFVRADVVISPRPEDYHPDHRNTGLLVRDAAYMVTVPNIVALVRHLRRNPIFIYMWDRFTHPSPFDPEIVVDIDDVIEKKMDMYHCHVSQMYEWLPYNSNILDQVPRSACSTVRARKG